MADFERTIYTVLDNLARNLQNKPINLGGVSGGGGGSGSPPGGFLGQLVQTRVAYDSTEAETDYTPSSGMSLVDNLNHIRYRIANIENSDGVDVDEDSTPVGTNFTLLNFTGAAVNVSDLGGGEALIQILGSGGGITDHGGLTGLDDPQDHPWAITASGGDGRYYLQTDLDSGQLDSRYYTESEINGFLALTLSSGVFGAKGDILVGTDYHDFTNLGVGSDGQFIVADSSEPTGVRWATVTNSIIYQQIVFTIAGANLVNLGTKPYRIYAYVPVGDGTLQEVKAFVATPPSTSNLRIDVKRGGASILTAGYVEITTGTNSASSSSFTDSAISNDDYFQIDIVQGDGGASDLTVHIRYTVP